MGRLHYLQRSIASLLQPWLLHKDGPPPLLLHFRFSHIVLELPFLELDCSALNSSLFSSSTFLLSNARIDRATLTISFFRSPGVFLELRGLHLIGNARPGEDSFWAARRNRSADDLKTAAISALDPQGAAVHAVAERLAKGEVSSSFHTLFWLSLALRAIRIELLDVTVELQSNSDNPPSHRCSLHSESVTLKEGFPDGAGRTAGLFGAVLVGLVDALRRVEGQCDKVCVFQNFCVDFSPAFETSIPTSSGAQNLPQYSHDSSHSPAGPDLVNERITARPNNSSRSVLLWKTVLLITTFCEAEFHGVDTDVTETLLHLNPADVEALLSIVNQLQGVPGKPIPDYASHQDSSREHSRRTSRPARYLWDKAVGRLVGSSWRRKLKYAVEARVLRHRYAQLYASWLRETGWGLINELSTLSARKSKKPALNSLERQLLLLEKELSAEAITLGRCVARCKVSTSVERSSKTATFSRGRGSDHFLTLLKPVVDGLKRIWKCFLLFFLCVYGILCKGTKRIGHRLFVNHVHHDKSTHAVAKRTGSCFTCRETTSGEEWTSSYRGNFQRGSLVFSGSSYSPTVRDHVRSNEDATSDSLSAGMGILLPASHFTWGNLFWTYQSNDKKARVEVICGSVQGELLPAVPTNISEESADLYDSEQRSTSKADNALKFLESGPAPNVELSERVREFVEDGEFYGNSFSGKNQLIPSGAGALEVDDSDSKKGSGREARPFFIIELQSSHADTRGLEISSGVVKCGLAVGRLDCYFDGKSFTSIAFLLRQFLEVLIVDTHSSKGDASGCLVDTSTGSSEQLKANEWEASYASWMKQYLSAVVVKKRLWLKSAIEGPKLELSLDFQGTSKGANELSLGLNKGENYTLVLSLGLVEATVWPAQTKEISLPAKQVDKECSSRNSWYDVKEMKKWLRKPPNPYFYDESMFEMDSEHEQIGNNAILYMHGAALTLQARQREPEAIPLVGPLKMTWECSLCRYFGSACGCVL